ncbi:hypothetical protein LOK49_LG05G01289 [Camellia lanceoleosa]|uniref:Uncharacterized protein n=1 Tax=Camellia lanceoleosa TaxID=1840588 RepID=A0ACC0HMP0_9ERIC|nr:hypothetical protein LOK49_LG05G01289 [Camellia lanceoleosa]
MAIDLSVNSEEPKRFSQALRQLQLLQQAVHHFLPPVLLQLFSQACYTSSAILRGVECFIAFVQINLRFVNETEEFAFGLNSVCFFFFHRPTANPNNLEEEKFVKDMEMNNLKKFVNQGFDFL